MKSNLQPGKNLGPSGLDGIVTILRLLELKKLPVKERQKDREQSQAEWRGMLTRSVRMDAENHAPITSESLKSMTLGLQCKFLRRTLNRAGCCNNSTLTASAMGSLTALLTQRTARGC